MTARSLVPAPGPHLTPSAAPSRARPLLSLSSGLSPPTASSSASAHTETASPLRRPPCPSSPSAELFCPPGPVRPPSSHLSKHVATCPVARPESSDALISQVAWRPSSLALVPSTAPSAGFSPPPLRPGAPRAAPGVTPASCPSYSTTWIPPGGQRDCKAWLGHCPPCPRHPRGSPPPWVGQGPRWSGCHPPAFTHSPKMLRPPCFSLNAPSAVHLGAFYSLLLLPQKLFGTLSFSPAGPGLGSPPKEAPRPPAEGPLPAVTCHPSVCLQDSTRVPRGREFRGHRTVCARTVLPQRGRELVSADTILRGFWYSRSAQHRGRTENVLHTRPLTRALFSPSHLSTTRPSIPRQPDAPARCPDAVLPGTQVPAHGLACPAPPRPCMHSWLSLPPSLRTLHAHVFRKLPLTLPRVHPLLSCLHVLASILFSAWVNFPLSF